MNKTEFLMKCNEITKICDTKKIKYTSLIEGDSDYFHIAINDMLTEKAILATYIDWAECSSTLDQMLIYVNDFDMSTCIEELTVKFDAIIEELKAGII